MILISHRGNTGKHNSFADENKPGYIVNALQEHFFVEVDLRVFNNELFLGHDEPQFQITKEWLTRHDIASGLLVHCKNVAALQFCMDYDLMGFYHKSEEHVPVINSPWIWTHNLSDVVENSIVPLLSHEEFLTRGNYKVAGVCSDFVGLGR